MFNFRFQGRKISTPLVSFSVLPVVALCGLMLVQAPAYSAQELTPAEARAIIESSVEHQVPETVTQDSSAQSQMQDQSDQQPAPSQSLVSEPQYQNTQQDIDAITLSKDKAAEQIDSATAGEFRPVRVEDLYKNPTDIYNAKQLDQAAANYNSTQSNVETNYIRTTVSTYSDSSKLTLNESDKNFKPFARKPAHETHSGSVQERFENLGETDLPSVEEYDQSILRKIDDAQAQQGAIVDEVNTDFNNRPAVTRSPQMIETQPRVTQQRVQLFDAGIASTTNAQRYDNSSALFTPVNATGVTTDQPKTSNSTSTNQANDAYIPPLQPSSVEKAESVDATVVTDEVEVVAPVQAAPAAVEVVTEAETVEKITDQGTEVLQIEKVETQDLVKPKSQAALTQEELAKKLTEESNLDTPDLKTSATPDEFYQQQQVEKQVEDIKQQASKEVMLDDLESQKTEALNQAQQNMQDTSSAIVETPQQVLNEAQDEVQQPLNQKQMQRALNEAETPALPSSYERNGIVENFDSYQEVEIDGPTSVKENVGLGEEAVVPESKEVTLPVNQEMILNKESGVIAGEEAQILTVEDAQKAIEEQAKK